MCIYYFFLAFCFPLMLAVAFTYLNSGSYEFE